MAALPALQANGQARDFLSSTPAKGDVLTIKNGKLVWSDDSCCHCFCLFGGDEENKKIWAAFQAALAEINGQEAARVALEGVSPKSKKKPISGDLFLTVVTRATPRAVPTTPKSLSLTTVEVPTPSVLGRGRYEESAATTEKPLSVDNKAT